ncbi:MAG: LysR family transcriptional regulator [Rhodospirillaceae bacterium]|nr:LysR family transcriptional regulator [Rhodospirillaceae bacterium]
MNLRDLKYLIAVAEKRHFGRAAEACHVSQPTLSGQIKRLEDQLGVAIFERTNRSVSVTPAGAEILKHARLALEQAEMIEDLAQAHSDPLAGPMRLGVIPTVSPYLMPSVLMPLRTACPAIRLVLSEEVTETLADRLKGHEIDAALLATDTDDHELETLPLFEEPFWVAFPRGHALSRLDKVMERDLQEVEMLLLTDGHCLRDQALDLCSRPARQTDSGLGDLRASSLETLLNMVAAGYGCTLMPALAVRGPWLTDMGIIARPIDSPNAKRTVRLVFRRSFPRRAALHALAGVIVLNLPNTVTPLYRVAGPVGDAR